MSNLSRTDFVMSCDVRKNPAAIAIERASAELAQVTGLLCETNRKRFAAFNDITGYVHPTADVPRALACAEWCNWLFFFDDVHDEDYESCGNVGDVARSMEQYLMLLRTGDARAAPSPLERLTLDFRDRVLGLASPEWFARFCSSVEDYLFRGVLRAIDNWISRRTPRLAEYLVQREFDSAVYTSIDLVEIAEGIELPERVVSSDMIRRVRQACNHTVSFFNDIVSYPKEVLKNKNPNNLVHVIASEYGCSHNEAVAETIRLVNEATCTILQLDGVAMGTDLSLAPALERYVMGMKYWQRGNIEWSLEGNRYRSDHSPFCVLRAGGESKRGAERAASGKIQPG